MKSVFVTLALGLLCASISCAGTKVPETALDKLSYSAGYQLGNRFKRQKLNVRPEMVRQGLEDALYGRRLPLTKAEMKQILQDPKKYLAEENPAQ
jgi:Domain amino terminal to FKBP-type peptidyl-prolyl isomerase